MEILLALLGALIGGTIGHFGGAVTGALVGWLCGRVTELSTEQRVFRAELAQLRQRLGDDAPQQPTPKPAPVVDDPLPRLDAQELSLRDQVIEPEPPQQLGGDPVHPGSRPEGLQPGDSEPEASSPFGAWLGNILSGENLLVKVGVVILFFGVAFLVKYAAQRGLFPLELRLTAAALGGCALLATGWRLRDRRPVYAQSIQGGGVGILYLTIFAAMRLYQLIPVPAGFVLLVIICALTGFLAVAQNSRPMAVLGSAGGFLAPELASLGSGSHIPLFAYYGVLNLGILGIARYRSWRELNLVGFIGTFIVSALWAARFYRPEYFQTVEPFLLLFFLIYALLPVLNARFEPTRLVGLVDMGLVFATPLITVAFQQQLVQRFEYGLALSCLLLAAFYLFMSGRLLRVGQQWQRMLAEIFLALGILFATMTIPLALEGSWTAAIWSIEGAALLWAGLRQQRLLARLAGYLLILGSGIVFAATLGVKSGPWPVANSFYLGCLLEAGAGLYAARLLWRQRVPEPEHLMEVVLFVWGMIWWFTGGLHEIAHYSVTDLLMGNQMLFVALSCLVCGMLRRRIVWRLLAVPSMGLLPSMGFFTILQLLDGADYPSMNGGWYGWTISLAAWYLMLHRTDQEGRVGHPILHAAPLWLICLLLGWESSGRILHHQPDMSTWAVSALGAVPALTLLLISRYGERLAWPIASHRPEYLGWGALPLAGASFCWLMYVNLTQPGTPWPLPYLPLVNPVDSVTFLAFVALAAWHRQLPMSVPQLAANLPEREMRTVGCAVVFIWLNAILLRTIHHWGSVPFTPHALFASLTVQTTLAIFWCLLALGAMTLATRRGVREIWLAGAGLLGAVVVKLFLVDLAGRGSVARIVSFVVVGLLILLIGWFAPAPPRRAEGRMG